MNSKKDKTYWMKEAFTEAQKAFQKNEVPVGALIIRKDQVLSRAHNLKEAKKCSLDHAEILAIRKASAKIKQWRLMDCEIYVTLEPCLMCVSALLQARIKKIYFGAYDLKAGALSLSYEIHSDRRLNHRIEMEYVPFIESEELLKKFFKNLREKKNERT